MTDSLRDELERWGLSDAAIDVYLSVLQLGEGRVSAVSDCAGVSKRSVYRIAERLETRGFVELQDHRNPTTVRATRPADLETMLQRRNESVLESVEAHYEAPPDRLGAVEVFKRDSTVVGRCRQLIADAERWLLFVAPTDLLARVADAIHAASERGVVVLLLTDEVTRVSGHAVEDLATVLRVREADDPVVDEYGLAVDYFRTLTHLPAAGPDAPGRYSPALYVDNENIAPRMMVSMRGNEWRLAEERAVPDPASLPREFDRWNEALIHAALHRRAGTPLRASVAAVSNDAGERTAVTGRVVDVRQAFVEPYNKSFLFEQAMILEGEAGRTSVGSRHGTYEDYRAESVRLERADET